MSRFVQLHVLTSYPPSNLNRDDTGRPKTALVGDALRLRISSQSLKRAWRFSEVFADCLPDFQSRIGTRTKRIGFEWIFTRLVADGVEPDTARLWSVDLQRAYGEPEAEDKKDADAVLFNTQLVHVSPAEDSKLASFVQTLSAYLRFGTADEAVGSVVKAVQRRNKATDKKKANATLARELGEVLLVRDSTSVDIAMFGRMLAAVPQFNFEAAVQVAHAFTVHKSAVEDDFFSAVDDLNKGDVDKGAGHIGERGYGAGLFYLYICINRELLKDNLGGDATLTAQALAALAQAITKVSPTGMQNSFASRAYASFVLGERGNQQPRSLAQAFLKPIKPYGDRDMLALAVDATQQRCENFDKVYGACADQRYSLNADTGEGTLAGLISFIQG